MPNNYFLVNASSPKPLDVPTPNLEGALVTEGTGHNISCNADSSVKGKSGLRW